MSLVSLLDGGELEALVGEQTDDGLLALSDDEDVRDSGCEGVLVGILHVGDVETSGVLLDVLEDADSADVVTPSHEHGSSVFELDEAVYFAALKIELYILNINIFRIVGEKIP